MTSHQFKLRSFRVLPINIQFIFKYQIIPHENRILYEIIFDYGTEWWFFNIV